MPGPMPPTLSPCILNKDIDPPTSAMCVPVPGQYQVLGWTLILCSGLLFSVAVVMYLDEATEGRKSLFELSIPGYCLSPQ